jgi:hypothetical protein
VNNNFLFIGYEPSLHDEIREFLHEKQATAHFSTTSIETIRIMDSIKIDNAVLNLHRLEDAVILRYINMHFHEVNVLLIPAESLKEAIPALTEGNYKILDHPFRLDDLKQFI